MGLLSNFPLSGPISKHKLTRTAALSLFLAFLLLYATSERLPSLFIQSNHPTCPNLTVQQRKQKLSDSNLLNLMFIDVDHRLIYLHDPKILLLYQLKSGSTALLSWVFDALSGVERAWGHAQCDTYIQNTSSPCWKKYATRLDELSREQASQIIASDDVLRVAVRREPFERLLSGYKSKYTCQMEKFGMEQQDGFFSNQLRKEAGLEPQEKPCLNLTEFANILDRIRRHHRSRDSNSNSVTIASPFQIESHVRLQRLHTNIIDYDIILDSSNMSDTHTMSPIYSRFQHKNIVPSYVPILHVSKDAPLYIPHKEHEILQDFVKLSQNDLGVLKNCMVERNISADVSKFERVYSY